MADNYMIDLLDIADELLIINKRTIDALMELDNASDCIALYVFYYKTAKWQKTNQIKATDTYAMKCLGWGKQRLVRTKDTLKEHGLIDIVQTRDADGTIKGWYIRLHYIVTQRELSDCKVFIQRYQNPQVDESTGGEQNTNALRQNNKCLKIEEEVLKGEFEKLWLLYPNKKGKKNALKYYIRARKAGTDYETVEAGIKAYIEYIRITKAEKYIQYGSTFFNGEGWNDDWSTGFKTPSASPNTIQVNSDATSKADEIKERMQQEWERQRTLK